MVNLDQLALFLHLDTSFLLSFLASYHFRIFASTERWIRAKNDLRENNSYKQKSGQDVHRQVSIDK